MRILLSFLLSFSLSLLVLNSQVQIEIDSNIHYQTIEGWGHGGSVFSGCGGFFMLNDTSISLSLSKDYLDYAIDELGLTGSRVWEVGPRIDGTGMDHGDCDSIDWSLFQSKAFFPWQYDLVKYFSDRIKSNGYQPSFYSSPTYPSLATLFKPWVLFHPGERAQQIWANAEYLKKNYDVDINYAVIYNEPGNPVTGTILQEDIKALGPRLHDKGLKTKVQFAEGVTPAANWNLINPLIGDSDFWKYVGRISYHNYGSADTFYRTNQKNLALSLGIRTAQTEMGDPNFDNLYEDLTIGNCSYWEVGYSSGVTMPLQKGQSQFSTSDKFFRLRQALHYVRPGDIRIKATTGDSIRVLAFSRNGKSIVVTENLSSPKTIDVSGLSPGMYGLSQTHGGKEPVQEMGIRTVGQNGKLTYDIIGNWGVTTLYPYEGKNMPPYLMSWVSDKGYLNAPDSSVTVTAIAADPELDKLTYKWSVYKQPSGSNAIIAVPGSPVSRINGISKAGSYIFKIDVSDGQYTVSKNLYLLKYDYNPPAVIGQSGFRFAQPYGLVFSYNGDTTHANIELPVSSCILQVGVGDLAGSDFTGRGKWSLVSAPAGSNIKVDSTIYIYVSIRANVTGMDIPGDYVFRCDVTNPPYNPLSATIKCTVHPKSSAPEITSIGSTPSVLFGQNTSTNLNAATYDNEGDLLRHWWSVKSAPKGVNPVFDHQGLKETNVSGLTKPGFYTFTLRVFDDIHMTAKDVTVKVDSTLNDVIDVFNNENEFSLSPNPATDVIRIIFDKIPYPENQIKVINAFDYSVNFTLSSSDFITNVCTLNISDLPTGLYFIRIGNKIAKFLKI